MLVRLLVLVCCLTAAAGCAHVRPTRSWAELGRRVSPGAPVSVLDVSGAEVSGRVVAFSASFLDVKVDGSPRRFDAANVRTVRRNGDALWNGLVVGLGIGAVGAALPDNRCRGQSLSCDDRQIPQRVAFLALATAIGVGSDRLVHDRTLLFDARRPMTLRLIPTIGLRQTSLLVVVGLK